ncbi:hypothetical protein K523DRAFT_350494 [Schizophyllum commune Tattone D]|nr:hypothetical protein K523DRAFT_350494 [Schizophyllum commune Tattone D]
MSQEEPTSCKGTDLPTAPASPSSVGSARHDTPALSSGKDSDSSHGSPEPVSLPESTRGSPDCPSRAISRGSFRASRTSSCGDAMRVTVPVKGADMSKTIPDSDIDDPAPTPSSICDAIPDAVNTDTKDQKRSMTPHERTSPQPIPVLDSATFGRKDSATGKDIRTARRTRAGRRAPTYAEVGPRAPMSANANRPSAYANIYTGQAQLPPHQVSSLSVAMTRLPLHPIPGNLQTPSQMPPTFIPPPYARAAYPPGYQPGHSRFMYTQDDPLLPPLYGGMANPPYGGLANPLYGGIHQAQLGPHFSGPAYSMPIYPSAQSQAPPPSQRFLPSQAIAVQRGYYGRLDFGISSTQVELEHAPELFYVRQPVGYGQQQRDGAQQQWGGSFSSGLAPITNQEDVAAPSSPPPKEPEPYYEIYPWAVNKPGDKPSKPVVKTAKSDPASAKPALASAPPFKRASSLKQVSSVKQTPSPQRTSSLNRTPSVKRTSSVKRTPSVVSVDVDPIEAAFHSHENTVLGNSVVEVLACLDLEAADEATAPIVARDARCAFAGKEGALSVIGNDYAFAATSEISALHHSTTATSFGPLGPCTSRQIDGTHAPLRRPAPAGELSVAPGALSGDQEGEEEWAPSEHRGFHF